MEYTSSNSDSYVRDTIYLATILFLIGISGHFRFFRIRLGLIILGGLMMVVAIFQIVTSPPIPLGLAPVPRCLPGCARVEPPDRGSGLIDVCPNLRP